MARFVDASEGGLAAHWTSMTEATPEPPPAPSIRRGVRFHRGNAVGLAVILLVVALALVGVFGMSTARVRADGGSVAVTVSYPSILRYKVIGRIDVTIEVGEQAVQDLMVAVSSDYLDEFSTVTFQPEVDVLTQDETIIRVDDVGPEQTRVVSGTIQGERYWLHEGWLEVRSREQTLARIALSTFVFP
jgi:hypothetical protein